MYDLDDDFEPTPTASNDADAYFCDDCGEELASEDALCDCCSRIEIGLELRGWELDLLAGELEVPASDEPPPWALCGCCPGVATTFSPSAGVPCCSSFDCAAYLDAEVAADQEEMDRVRMPLAPAIAS
jgi:hypothetical protein